LLELTNAQDYIAQRGQGVIADRSQELLGRSDRGLALLRRILLRETDLLAAGVPTKTWRSLDEPAPMPTPTAVAAS
jgi:5,5'-dehydrodivanillate O-demethylase